MFILARRPSAVKKQVLSPISSLQIDEPNGGKSSRPFTPLLTVLKRPRDNFNF
jgi:hypothetical protein